MLTAVGSDTSQDSELGECRTESQSDVSEDTLAAEAVEESTVWDKYEPVAEHLQHQLMTHKDCVVDTTVLQTARGWNVTAYVKPNKLKSQAEGLKKVAQHAVLDAVNKAEIIYILGYNVQPFTSVPLGLGCTLVEMPDLDNACWGSYSNGFCCSPGSCKLQHPKMTGRVVVNLVLKPARGR